MTGKVKQFLVQLPYLPRACGLIWSAARRWTLAWAILLILQGLLPVATVYLTRDLVDSLSRALQAGGDWAAFRQPALLVGWMALILLGGEIAQSLIAWVRTAQAELVQDHISGLIHAKAAALDLLYYDTADYYDRLHRARIDALSKPVALLENLGNLLQSGLTFVAMGGVLLAFGWWLPVVLMIGVAPALWVVARATLHEHGWRQRTTAARRRTNYYDWLVTDQESAAELRLFALGKHFQQAYQTLRQRLRNERITLARQQALAGLLAGVFALLTTGLLMLWMIGRALQNAFTLGDLAMFYQAFNQGQRLMQTLLGSVGQIYSNLLFLENLFEFLALQPQMREPATPTPLPHTFQQGICLHNITFHYPGSERVALDNFNLTIPAGQIVAIVGENGAGKSTLIKLLCRFYDPTAGAITLDGIDLRQFSQHELRRRITVLFQQPVHYHATAAENIALGDLAMDAQAEEVEIAARAAGADIPINRLPQGYETMLGKWFGGAELSGGEWQRVALARAFVRQADLIILDEPTSAMDSWAEADWMARFRQLVAGRTTLMITHRFTTAMHADRIYVMAQGRIVESGTHAQLLKHGGRYAESWQRQLRQPPTPH